MIKQCVMVAGVGLLVSSSVEAYGCMPQMQSVQGYAPSPQASPQAGYYAQQRAVKAKKLAEMRKRAKAAHARAVAAQKARRAAALARQRAAGHTRVAANAYAKPFVRPAPKQPVRQQAVQQARQTGGINYAGMTPREQQIIMAMQLQQQQVAANLLGGMYQRNANMQMNSLNRLTAATNCSVTGNCYVRTVPR